MDYTVRYIEYDGRKDDFVFDFQKGYEVLSLFLSCELPNFYQEVKNGIEEVRDGKVQKKTIVGNVCKAEIDQTITKVIDLYSEKSNTCALETEEFIALIKEWNKEKQELEKYRLK